MANMRLRASSGPLVVVLILGLVAWVVVLLLTLNSASSCLEQKKNEIEFIPPRLDKGPPVQVLLGVFCRIQDKFMRYAQRMLFRQKHDEILEKYNVNVTWKFVVGQNYTKGTDELEVFHRERKVWGDIVFLPTKENMNEGKSFDWLNEVVTLTDLQPHPDFVFKMDTDVLVMWDAWALDMSSMPVGQLVYYGRMNDWEICHGGSAPSCPPPGCRDFTGTACSETAEGRKCEQCWIYMSGGFYMLSYPLIQMLHRCSSCNEWYLWEEDLAIAHALNATLREHLSADKIRVFHRPNGGVFLHNDNLRGEKAFPIFYDFAFKNLSHSNELSHIK
uniref:Hexosyltransferase n=1 Tax=Chromera velia CCMP2878 TaxID=1169474 RepID=A0A0G4HB26_9ALVE|mmetsp:Transcript_18211/g.36925  ORF Transcript_18211/g.36925 Transcript_18211/m.36925 type:complete len:331 (+) Transcript_18211:213-1205(+)|eukprot:Cvel_6169.t1-p1 / transcript=Cvel_6169.t1 / gene=Cvel_6169 / organism=Chromera_velia_CCMP2878 / gene_product=hypothetical protein / transcript_product=hypothetical protein / location=Cvel_scaffold298:88515-91775(+) / protein_length=330 / sequence_SO=supercontig / SO=protein_coding / is_pseudo=false